MIEERPASERYCKHRGEDAVANVRLLDEETIQARKGEKRRMRDKRKWVKD